MIDHNIKLTLIELSYIILHNIMECSECSALKIAAGQTLLRAPYTCSRVFCGFTRGQWTRTKVSGSRSGHYGVVSGGHVMSLCTRWFRRIWPIICNTAPRKVQNVNTFIGQAELTQPVYNEWKHTLQRCIGALLRRQVSGNTPSSKVNTTQVLITKLSIIKNLIISFQNQYCWNVQCWSSIDM